MQDRGEISAVAVAYGILLAVLVYCAFGVRYFAAMIAVASIIGLPAVLIVAPLLFPIAAKLGLSELPTRSCSTSRSGLARSCRRSASGSTSRVPLLKPKSARRRA